MRVTFKKKTKYYDFKVMFIINIPESVYNKTWNNNKTILFFGKESFKVENNFNSQIPKKNYKQNHVSF